MPCPGASAPATSAITRSFSQGRASTIAATNMSPETPPTASRWMVRKPWLSCVQMTGPAPWLLAHRDNVRSLGNDGDGIVSVTGDARLDRLLDGTDDLDAGDPLLRVAQPLR